MREDFEKLYRLLTPRERKKGVMVAVVMTVAAGLQALAVGSLFPFLSLVTDSGAIESGWLQWLYTNGGFTSYHGFLLSVGLGVLLLVVVSNAALSFAEWLRLRFKWGVNHSLSVRLMRQYLSRDYTYFLDENTSELHRNVLNESAKVSAGLLGPVLTMLKSTALATAMVAVLLFIDPVSMLVVVGVVGGGYGLAYLLIRRRLVDIGESYSEANSQRFKITSEAFSGIKDVKLLGREDFFLDAYKPASRTVSRTQADKSVFSTLPKYVIEALAVGGLLSVLLLLLVTGQPVSSIVPIMGTFAFAGYRMMPAFRDILNALSGFRFTDEIFRTIEEALEEKERTNDPLSKPGEQPDPLPFNERIQLEDVSYVYPTAQTPAIRDVSLSIQKNSAVAFVGRTGAGKTTIIDVILGLLQPSEGQLSVDGVPVTHDNKRRWQRNIGYVPQEISLSDTTVARNIAFGVPEDQIDQEAVRRAAEIAHIHEFISQELPQGYETAVGEEGVRLSGGQRQRIGIARALYHDPPVIVFDEATSDIDGVTEANITEAIQELHGSKTVVTVAHRLKTIQNCDMIHLVHDGEVVASGSFESLNRSSDRFNRMVGEQIVQASE